MKEKVDQKTADSRTRAKGISNEAPSNDSRRFVGATIIAATGALAAPAIATSPHGAAFPSRTIPNTFVGCSR